MITMYAKSYAYKDKNGKKVLFIGGTMPNTRLFVYNVCIVRNKMDMAYITTPKGKFVCTIHKNLFGKNDPNYVGCVTNGGRWAMDKQTGELSKIKPEINMARIPVKKPAKKHKSS